MAGNHDLSLDSEFDATKYDTGWNVMPEEAEACRETVVRHKDIVYLQHGPAKVDLPEKNVTLNIFGSPYSVDRGKQNWAFQYPQSRSTEIWNAIPQDIDILITHTHLHMAIVTPVLIGKRVAVPA